MGYYHPELDGLRFLAFLLVFISHAPCPGSNPVWRALNEYGWVGVDLFLSLSAFLFTQLLYVEYRRTGSINVPYFYVRRTLRIWPLYFVFVIAMSLLSRYQGVDVGSLRTIGVFTFTDNLISAALLSYSPVLFSAHLWTIAYEEQFYAVIPWVLRNLFAISMRARTLVLLSAMGLGSAIRAIFIRMQVPHPAIWVLPFTHFESILFGLMLGLGVMNPMLDRIPWPVTGLMGLMCLAFVCTLPNVFVISWWLMGTYLLVGLGTTLILNSVLRGRHALSWISSRPVVFLGKISYGLYVYHLLCLRIASDWAGAGSTSYQAWTATFVLPLLATIAVSALSYVVLEKPFLLMKERFAIVASRPA